MDGVAATEPGRSIARLPGVFTLLEEGTHTTSQLRLERLATLPLGERSPLVVCFESPDAYIRVIWGTQFISLYFAQPTPKNGKALAFAWDIRLGQILAKVVVQLEWLTPGETVVPWKTDMEALLTRLATEHLWLAADTQQLERVSVPRASLAHISLVDLLMVSPFLSPLTAWHMMHVKANAMGITQRVSPFMDCLRAKIVKP